MFKSIALFAITTVIAVFTSCGWFLNLVYVILKCSAISDLSHCYHWIIVVFESLNSIMWLYSFVLYFIFCSLIAFSLIESIHFTHAWSQTKEVIPLVVLVQSVHLRNCVIIMLTWIVFRVRLFWTIWTEFSFSAMMAANPKHG